MKKPRDEEVAMYLKQFFVDGLGHASYIISSDETREAAVVDPRRDIGIYTEVAAREGLKIRYVLETHNHNDFISGAKQLAESVGAEHVASAEAGLKFPYHGVRDGDELTLGELKIRVLFTPGHTPEHVSYTVADTLRADVPVLVFTGGDLLVGSVGRPDLLGRELGEELAPMLYDSLHDKILKLEDYVEVLPTHGGGSLCGKSIARTRWSTIGYERRFNPALQQKTKEEFVRYVLSGNPGIPTYYRRMRPTNQAGPSEWHVPEARALTPKEVQHLTGHDAIILDTRTNVAFGGGHIPGAINIGLSHSFATWVGWLLPSDVPIVLVLDHDEQWAGVVTRLARIGYENVAGYLQGGMTTWINEALPLEHVPQWSVHELYEHLGLGNLRVLDVRTDSEWEEDHIDGAIHIPLDSLPERMFELDRGGPPMAVLCGSGYRSSIAVSLLQRNGLKNLINIPGSMSAWHAAKYPTVKPGEDEKSAGHERRAA